MARHEMLSQTQRDELSTFPDLSERELARYYTLTQNDLDIIVVKRSNANRLGFAVQLALLRFPGRALSPSDSVPQDLISYLGKQLEINPKTFEVYAKARDTTRREHLREIIEQFAFKEFSNEREALRSWLLPIALSTDNAFVLVEDLITHMREHRIILPAVYSLEEFAWDVRQQARTQLQNKLTSQLTDEQKTKLDALLDSEIENTSSPLVWLRQAAPNPTATGFLSHFKRLEHIRALELNSELIKTIHQNRLKQLTREGSKITPHNLKRLVAPHRYAILVAYLLDSAERITDELLDMHDRMMTRLLSKSEQLRDEAFLKQGKGINEKVNLYATLGKALIQAKAEGNDPFLVIDSLLGWAGFVETVQEAEKLAHPVDFDYLMFALSRFAYYRQYTPMLLADFEFKAAANTKDLKVAIDLLITMNQEAKRKVPEHAPIDFLKQRWRSYVIQPEGIHRQYYELAVLNELRHMLRSGDLWVKGSKRYQDFEDYLLPQADWQALKASGDLPIPIRVDAESYLEDRAEQLHQTMTVVEQGIKKNALPDVRLQDGRLKISPLKSQRPAGISNLRRQLYKLFPRIRLTDLLVEVDSWTGFTRHFTHLQSDESCKEKAFLLSVILADGINLGLDKMAQACTGLNYQQLAWVADWHVRDETYQRALADLVNTQHRHPFARHWGDGSTSSSDGQFFKSGGQRDLGSQTNARYGTDPGITFYSHISDHYAPFYSRVISTTTRDASYVLDGLLYHETEIDPKEHYTDTHGYTDQVFAMCHLLGFSFAPRIRDLKDKKLYTFENPKFYPTLLPLIGAKADRQKIKTQWDDVLRLACSIKQGTVTASLMLKKLAAYPRQNSLAWALREIGRVEKTLFSLDWFQNPDLRRRVSHGLNKSELRNALAKSVFVHRLGEIRDRSMESQLHRASGLNLIIAAIVLWNTVYLDKAVSTLRGKSISITDEQLKHIAPIAWNHINLTGDYHWDFSQQSSLDRLRPLRTS